jgi:hypothetical protein
MSKKAPPLRKLRYGSVFCELCHEAVHAGDPVAWWPVASLTGQKRLTAYCQTCHHSNVRRGESLR